jgi:hypothetical protein
VPTGFSSASILNPSPLSPVLLQLNRIPGTAGAAATEMSLLRSMPRLGRPPGVGPLPLAASRSAVHVRRPGYGVILGTAPHPASRSRGWYSSIGWRALDHLASGPEGHSDPRRREPVGSAAPAQEPSEHPFASSAAPRGTSRVVRRSRKSVVAGPAADNA